MLAGGELPAMVVADAVLRKLPGALGDAESAVEESFSEALEGAPEYPHYTRPPTTGAGRCPRSCSPAITPRSASGGARSRERAENATGLTATIRALRGPRPRAFFKSAPAPF